VSGNCCDATECDDGDVCTTDTCESNQCAHTAVPNCCHDATDCPASTDQCKVATCTANRCGFGNKADGTACDDGDACTQTDTCQAGACTGGNPVVCTASDQCHVAGTCDPATGTCSNPAKTDGTPCEDGLFCTTGDTCQAGVCTGGTSPCNAAQCLTCDEANNQCVNTCPVGTQCDGSGNCVNICTNRSRSVYCPSKTGHGFKCCPTDSVCDYNGDVVNCRNI
jgi:hypothetical protein